MTGFVVMLRCYSLAILGEPDRVRPIAFEASSIGGPRDPRLSVHRLLLSVISLAIQPTTKPSAKHQMIRATITTVGLMASPWGRAGELSSEYT